MRTVRTMTQGYQLINLEDLTDFEWDSVYFFKGGSVSDITEINKRIGFKWDGEPVGDGVRRLLFVRGQKVVSYTDFMPNGDGHEQPPMPIWMLGCPGTKGWGISRKEARFAVFRDCSGGGKAYPVYMMVPLTCKNDFRILIEQGCSEKTLEIVNGPHLYDSTGRLFPVKEDSTGRLVPVKN